MPKRRRCLCKEVLYCDTVCQSKDWKTHKLTCPYRDLDTTVNTVLAHIPAAVAAQVKEYAFRPPREGAGLRLTACTDSVYGNLREARVYCSATTTNSTEQ